MIALLGTSDSCFLRFEAVYLRRKYSISQFHDAYYCLTSDECDDESSVVAWQVLVPSTCTYSKWEFR